MKFRINLTKKQWERISEILSNLGVLNIGSIFLPFIFDKSDYLSAFMGLGIAMGLWYTSLVAAKEY